MAFAPESLCNTWMMVMKKMFFWACEGSCFHLFSSMLGTLKMNLQGLLQQSLVLNLKMKVISQHYPTPSRQLQLCTMRNLHIEKEVKGFLPLRGCPNQMGSRCVWFHLPSPQFGQSGMLEVMVPSNVESSTRQASQLLLTKHPLLCNPQTRSR